MKQKRISVKNIWKKYIPAGHGLDMSQWCLNHSRSHHSRRHSAYSWSRSRLCRHGCSRRPPPPTAGCSRAWPSSHGPRQPQLSRNSNRYSHNKSRKNLCASVEAPFEPVWGLFPEGSEFGELICIALSSDSIISIRAKVLKSPLLTLFSFSFFFFSV